MKVFKKGDFEVTKIEFCCREMAEDVLLGRTTASQWTDHPLRFFHGNGKEIQLDYCFHCGARIDGDAT